MNIIKSWALLILTTGLFFSGCTYQRGEAYYYVNSGDTVKYIVRNAGNGRMIMRKVSKQREIHQLRQDDYRFVFLSDSAEVVENKSILLSHSEMPDYEDDMLTKGYMGAFGTKEVVTYMIVMFSEAEEYFVEESEVTATE